MADSNTIVTLNIGSQRIGMAVFDATKSGGLSLKGFASETIVADPAHEAARIGQVRVAVGDLAKRLKVPKTKVRYAIAGQSVFVRFVKLPPLQDDNIEQLVTYEAQQHVPFPIDEVIWDYEMIEGAADKEVAIVAIKSDALDELNGAINEAGLATAEVDAAPMALYNSFMAAYGPPAEPVLIIDVGARTSNLLYLEGRRFFTRNIPVGGAAVTAAVAKEYNVSFLEAEHQKITNGLVALGAGHTEQLDESVAALAMVIRNALSRLPSEITRTTNYYRSQHGGSAPKRVYLCGGGANLPYTLEFFEEKLNLPVEFFNPLKAIGIGKNVDTSILQREAHLMGELIGLGLRGVGKSRINIDLVPTVVEKIRADDRRKPFLIAAAAVFLGGVAVWSGLQVGAASKARQEAENQKQSVETLQPLADQVSALIDTENNLRAVADSLTGAEIDRTFWAELLGELGGNMAHTAIWITDIEPLTNFDPFASKPVATGPVSRQDDGPAQSTGSGRAAVRPDFVTTPFGQSSLASARGGPDLDDDGPRGGAADENENEINAVRVHGFWRAQRQDNPEMQKIVSVLLKRLQQRPEVFTFIVDGKPVPDENILKVSLGSADSQAFAHPFEITLPLARPVRVK